MKAARTRALNKKHAGTAKHSSTTKHTPTATRKAAKAAKQTATRTAAQVKAARARAWTPDGTVALCSARAFAESLRIATGRAVSHADVLDVYWLTAADADAGASILATAEAISASGLGGHFTLGLREVMPCDDVPSCWCCTAARHRVNGAGLILGLDLPGAEPHAVAVGPDGTWWSWGEPFDPADWPGLAVEEAWAVTWQ